MKMLLIISVTFFTFQNMYSQALSDFQWKNRLIVVFSETKSSEAYLEQLDLLENDSEGLKDRKLKVIHSIPGKHQIMFPLKSAWQDSNLYQKKESKSDFEVILIGLDGGVKLRETKILETKKLFDLIDSMPMRQSEIRKRKN